MRFCPFCSAENADELAVCQACGRRLPPLPPRRARNAPPTGIQLPHRPATPSTTPPPTPTRRAGSTNPPPIPQSGPQVMPGSVRPSSPHAVPGVPPSGPQVAPGMAAPTGPQITTASGEVGVETCCADCSVQTASGDVTLGVVEGDLKVKTASGDVTVRAAEESVRTRTASGDVELRQVRAGKVEVDTVSGEVEIGVERGVSVYLDVSSLSGGVSSSLEPADAAVDGALTLELRVKTVSGAIQLQPV